MGISRYILPAMASPSCVTGCVTGQGLPEYTNDDPAAWDDFPLRPIWIVYRCRLCNGITYKRPPHIQEREKREREHLAELMAKINQRAGG